MLSPAAIADLRAELRRLVAAPDDTGAQAERLDREIRNLADAIATAGYVPELQRRLEAATRQRDTLRARPHARAIDVDEMVADYREALLILPAVLAQDISAARTALRETIGEIPLEQRGKEVWARITTSPGQLLLTGTDDSGNGSGGPITNPEYRVRIR